MARLSDNYYGGGIPPEQNMQYFEDTHATSGSSRVSGSAFGLNGSIIVYCPKSPQDVEMIINYLKTRQLAIIQLPSREDANKSQRILDMLSGAVYALDGSVAVINREQNMYLLTPSGVSINVPIKK